jgi:endonuclease I
MHAIFAASKHANGSRGNIPFGNFGLCTDIDKYGKRFK